MLLYVDVYGYCFYNDSFEIKPNNEKPTKYESQESMLMRLLAKARKQQPPKKFNGAPCAYFDGVFKYFNLNEVAYHAKWSGQKWNGPCVRFFLNLG